MSRPPRAPQPGPADDETQGVFPLERRTIFLDGTEETLIEPGPRLPGGIGGYPEDPPPPAPDRGSPLGESILLFVVLLLVYLAPWHGSGLLPTAFTSRDTLGNRLIAASLGGRGELDITPWVPGGPNPELMQHVFEARTRVEGTVASTRYAPKYPFATGLLAAPFFIGVPATALDHALVGNGWRSLAVRDHLAAAVMTALAVALFHHLIRTMAFGGLGAAAAFVLSIGLGLGSPLWSANSQGLWSHTGSTLAVVLLLHLLARTGVGATIVRTWRLFAVGIVAGVAAACRPSQLVWLGTIPIALAVVARRFGFFSPTEFLNRLAAFLLGAGVVLGGLIWLHYQLYGQALSPYISGLIGLGSGTLEVEHAAGFGEALAGQLLSPGVGLLVFCPLVLLAIGGLRVAWFEGVDEVASMLTVGLLVVMNAMNPFWWGGWSWGPRLFADAMPMLLLLAIPAVRALTRHGAGRVVAWLLVLWAAALQSLGVGHFDHGWFAERPDLAEDRAPLWNVRHGLVADAMRGGRPADPPPNVPDAWRPAPLQPPAWLADGVAAAGPDARLVLLRLDLDALPDDATDLPFSGWMPVGAFPHRLIGSTSLEGALIYRDKLQLRLPGEALTGGAGGRGHAWLAMLLPIDDRHASVSEAIRLHLGEAGEPIPTFEQTLERDGRRWWFALWPLPASGGGDAGEGALVTIRRQRALMWGDPLATIPPFDLVPMPFVIRTAD